jgi:light-regulated signal transduction histidine kinase (bacteriophytochrome)
MTSGAPIRHVEGYAKVLAESSSIFQSSDEKKFVNNILEATARMSEIVEGMMLLSGINSAELNRSEIDLSHLSLSIFNKAVEACGCDVEFVVQDGLKATADANLVKIALHNLIDNALKYSCNQENPRIEIGSFDTGEKSGFYIKDNGAGFSDPEKQLFQPFRRLHKKSEFDGNGIGLATVARVINKHNGIIWAESSPGMGATFYFTL